MEDTFAGRVAIITGAGSGIGFEIARQLIKRGAQVVLNDISEELTKKAATTITAEGPGTCIGLAGDAGSLEHIDSLIATAVDQFGSVDYAVANAGITQFGDFFEQSYDSFRKVLNVNVEGSFFLAQAAAKQMRKQGNGGRIVLMSSVVGELAHPHLTAYAMTKAALNVMARSLVLELGPHNISINAVSPGATLTERTVNELPDYEGQWGAIIPNGRVATTEDIANAALFLLSPAARHINGQTITVDGGWTGIGHTPY